MAEPRHLWPLMNKSVALQDANGEREATVIGVQGSVVLRLGDGSTRRLRYREISFRGNRQGGGTIRVKAETNGTITPNTEGERMTDHGKTFEISLGKGQGLLRCHISQDDPEAAGRAFGNELILKADDRDVIRFLAAALTAAANPEYLDPRQEVAALSAAVLGEMGVG